jgi:hypothetical protein
MAKNGRILSNFMKTSLNSFAETLSLKGTGFTSCGNTLFFEAYGLQPVRKGLETGPAKARLSQLRANSSDFSLELVANSFR